MLDWGYGLTPVLGLWWVLDWGVVCPQSWGCCGCWLGGEVCSLVLGIVVGTGLRVCLSLVLGVWWALAWGIICSLILWVQWALAWGLLMTCVGAASSASWKLRAPWLQQDLVTVRAGLGHMRGPECLSDTGERNPLSSWAKISPESVEGAGLGWDFPGK